MELNLTSLTGLGMSEDLINQMFKSRGINLSAKELRESKSLRKLPEKQKPLSKDNDYSSKDSSELHRKILNAQRIGDFEAVSKILIEAVKKQNLSLVVRRKMVLDLIVSFIEQKKHYEIQDIIDAHRSMFTNCGNFEGECLRASLDLFQHYVYLQKKGYWNSYFNYQREIAKIEQQLLPSSPPKVKSGTNEYFEDAHDYLLKTIEKVGLEFQVKENKKDGSMEMISTSGINTGGELGLGDKKEFPKSSVIDPIAIFGLKNRKVLQIACGEYHTIALVSSCLPKDRNLVSHLPQVDVVGWGDNSFGQVTNSLSVKKYCKPVIISALFDKQIQGVACFGKKSACFDNLGAVYEWGAGSNKEEDDLDIEIKSKYMINGIKDLKMGSGFTVSLSDKGMVYCQGTVKDGKKTLVIYDKPYKISSFVMKSISVGFDHVLAVDNKRRLFAFGNNKYSQCGFSQSKKSFLKVLEECEIFKGELIQNQWALKDLSMIKTDHENLFFGKYSHDPEKIAKYPQDFSLGESAGIKEIQYSKYKIYALNERGQVYLWDMRVSHRFKEEKFKNNCFEEIRVGQGFIMLKNPYIVPEKCRVSLEGDQDKCEAMDAIKLKIKLQSETGPIHLDEIDYQLRVCFLVSRTEAGGEIVEDYSQDSSNVLCQSDEKVVLKTLNEDYEDDDICILKVEYKGIKDGWLKVELTLDSTGAHYISFCINERKIDNIQRIYTNDSYRISRAEEKQKMKELKKEKIKQKKLEKLEKKKRMEEEKKALEEKRRLKVKLQAEQALRDEMKKKREKIMKERAERKLRKEIITGGGFNLDKLRKMAKKPLRVFPHQQIGDERDDITTQNSSNGFRKGGRKSTQFSATQYDDDQEMANSTFSDMNNPGFGQLRVSSTMRDRDQASLARKSGERGFKIKKKKGPIIRPRSNKGIPSNGIMQEGGLQSSEVIQNYSSKNRPGSIRRQKSLRNASRGKIMRKSSKGPRKKIEEMKKRF